MGEGEEVVVVVWCCCASVDILSSKEEAPSSYVLLIWCNNVAELLLSVLVGDSRQTTALRVRYAERQGCCDSHRSQGVECRLCT